MAEYVQVDILFSCGFVLPTLAHWHKHHPLIDQLRRYTLTRWDYIRFVSPDGKLHLVSYGNLKGDEWGLS